MTFEEIIWLDQIVEKLSWKHRVLPAEVEEVLVSRSTRHFRNQKGRIEGEDVYNALGKTENGRYLSVFVTIQAFCHRGHREHRDIKKFLIKSQIQGYKALNALHEVVDTPKSSSVTSVVSVAE